MAHYIVNANGALPVDFFPDSPKSETNKKFTKEQLIADLRSDVILLKKQLRRAKREADAYRNYVPKELLPVLVQHTPEQARKKSIDAGQITAE